jgi:hypothetical protein
MGEKQNQLFQFSFSSSLKVDFQGSCVTSDGGLILLRELDERLGFGELIEEHLTDPRRGKNTQFPFVDLLRQSVYSVAMAQTVSMKGASLDKVEILALVAGGCPNARVASLVVERGITPK